MAFCCRLPTGCRYTCVDGIVELNTCFLIARRTFPRARRLFRCEGRGNGGLAAAAAAASVPGPLRCPLHSPAACAPCSFCYWASFIPLRIVLYPIMVRRPAGCFATLGADSLQAAAWRRATERGGSSGRCSGTAPLCQQRFRGSSRRQPSRVDAGWPPDRAVLPPLLPSHSCRCPCSTTSFRPLSTRPSGTPRPACAARCGLGGWASAWGL